MKLLKHSLLILLLVTAVSLPLSASALGISFGGRVLFVVPCSGLRLFVTILPAGKFPISYIWSPFTTITELVGPPIPGGQVVGIADYPTFCSVGGWFSPVKLFGLHMQYIGTSLPSV